MKHLCLMATLMGLLACSAAAADTVDFTTLPDGDQGSKSVTVSGVTFTGATDLYNTSAFDFTSTGGSICSFSAAAFSCANNMTVKFNGKVNHLKLATAGADAGDQITITGYKGKKSTGAVVVTTNGKVDLSGLKGVTKLVITDASSANGMDYGDFKFHRTAAAAAKHAAKMAAAAASATTAAPAAAKATHSGAGKAHGKAST